MKTRKQTLIVGGLLLVALLVVFLFAAGGRFFAADDATQISASIWSGYKREAKTHVSQRLLELESLAPIEGGALFIGDSITEFAPLASMFPGVLIANYGVGWGTSDGLLLRLDQITRNAPDRVFVLMGTNDIHYGHAPEHIAGNIVAAVTALRRDMPDTEIYVISLLPREPESMAAVRAANALLKERAAAGGYVYLDVSKALAAPDGSLRADLTTDGLHLNAPGYAALAKAMGLCVLSGCEALPQ